MPERFLTTLRRLATCFQAFEAYSSAHLRTLGLTPPQFDVIATLGNQPGMSCRELGERTLITKGTLTGVLDRLEARGLLSRGSRQDDRRGVHVSLTPAGEAMFEAVFPPHVAHLRHVFDELPLPDLERLEGYLDRLTARLLAEPAPDRPATPKTRMIAAARRAA
jgi:MarR family 2-MHQ and catechol resistance regulon transcriptional repressor